MSRQQRGKCPGYQYGCGKTKWLDYPFCYNHVQYFIRKGLLTMGEKTAPQPLRFSASYASRYNNCHGSANLEEAIPGFEHPPRNDDGMKGEGTRLHKIFELATSKHENLRAAAALLREIATMWGPHRTKWLEQDEKSYLVGYFLKHKTAPPLELPDLLAAFVQYKPVIDTDSNPTYHEDGTPVIVAAGVAPRRIVHLAESMEYAADLIDEIEPDSIKVLTELKVQAKWLVTEPYTTTDLLITGILKETGESVMHVIDLKAGDVEVSVINNEQLMYYAKTYGADNYTKVVLHILQRNGTDSWELPKSVLDAWVDKVQSSEAAILGGDLTLTAGSHCKFCPANPHTRGDKGTKACPVMMEVLYGARDKEQADNEVLEEEEWEDD
ncbi:Cas4 family exonuclease [Microbacterium phage CrunchyBoi]|nr:Cas4 family exonuclease [Microbacterium phage PineapplePluto]QQO39358.1 Cas4 family exonuclease [Microbacterium phage CrunchyBoi]